MAGAAEPWFFEHCDDPEGFAGCIFLCLPQTDGKPLLVMTCLTGCALLHCRSPSDNGENDNNNENEK